MSRRNGSVPVIILVVVILAVLAAGIAYYYLSPSSEEPTGEMLFSTATSGPFEFLVIAQGEVESSVNVEIRCEVKSRNSGGTIILDVVQEGTNVKPGDLLVRLDSTALEQEQLQQQISCNSSEALMVQAKNILEAEQIALKEYEEGTFHQEEQRIQSELFVAQENLRRAQQYERFSERLAAKGYVTALQLEGDRFAVDKTRNELKTAETSLSVLREYTQQKMIKNLETAIAIAASKWKSEQSSYQLEMDKLNDIKDQIGKCEVRAATSGTVVHANRFSSRGGNAEFIVEPGAMVRETQVIIRLPDRSHMQVKAKINEARITLVQRENTPVLVRMDALNDRVLEGRLTKVNQYAEPRSWSSGSIREYAAFIRLLDPPPEIRPGMNAEVQILVDKQDKVLQVPVQSICEHKRKYFCMVKKPGGAFETREVEVGISNEKFMTIMSGLAEGESVVMNPRGFPSELRLPDLPDPPSDATDLPNVSSATKHGGAGGPGGDAAGKKKKKGGRPSVAQIVSSSMEMDTDGDGALSSEEMQSLPEDRRQRLKAADKNNDGKVDRAELTSHLAQRAKPRKGGEQAGGGAPGGQDGSGRARSPR